MDDKAQQMIADLTERTEKLRTELLDLEKTFNAKKDEYLKLQGALEAAQLLSQ